MYEYNGLWQTTKDRYFPHLISHDLPLKHLIEKEMEDSTNKYGWKNSDDDDEKKNYLLLICEECQLHDDRNFFFLFLQALSYQHRVNWKTFVFLFGNNDEKKEEGTKFEMKNVRESTTEKQVCLRRRRNENIMNKNEEKNVQKMMFVHSIELKNEQMCGEKEIEVKSKQVLHTNEQWDCVIFRIRE